MDSSENVPSEAINAVYFNSYEELSVHELMLKDKPRTEAYQNAILKNKGLFENKTVMDIGAGTGILSLFAAKAGAKKVYAVEASNLAATTKKIVEDNGFAEIIEVLNYRLEDLPTSFEKVDIIISEWMGFYLLHESMLNTIIYGRDNFLKPEGLLFPSSAQIYASAINLDTLYDSQINFWENVYGFNFSSILPAAKQTYVLKNSVLDVIPENVISSEFLIEDFNLYKITENQINFFQQKCFFSVNKDSLLHGFAIWFDVKFPKDPNNGEEVVLSTAPGAPKTHWQQFAVKTPDPVNVYLGDLIEGSFTFKQDFENPRFYNVTVEVDEITHEDDGDDEDMDEDAELFCLPGHEANCDCIKCEIARSFLKEEEKLEDEEEIIEL